jgi:hypothetical protein
MASQNKSMTTWHCTVLCKANQNKYFEKIKKEPSLLVIG